MTGKYEKVIHVRVSNDMYNRLQSIAEELGIHVSVIVRLAIVQFIKDKKTIEDISSLIVESIGGRV